MRGKDVQVSAATEKVRITPAHAGKSFESRYIQRPLQDHPRACGEKETSPKCLFMLLGSPPRMRGKDVQVSAATEKVRITPAHAGKRSGKNGCGVMDGDHPRACGEKWPGIYSYYLWQGSPPRMRGKVEDFVDEMVEEGITPAHAGKRKSDRRRRGGKEDHPRACGEKSAPTGCFPQVHGSPPRMRGKGWRYPSRISTCRITPAHAGKRTANILPVDLHRDHPRACGEKQVTGTPVTVCAGSPPRMRGKARPLSVSTTSRRITPAHAGKRTAQPGR